MPDHLKIQSIATSISSNGPLDDTIEEKEKREGMSKMKREEDEEEKEKEERESREYPDRPGEPDCLYYLRTGLCDYGTNCRFNHPPLLPKSTPNRSEFPQRDGQPDCGHYLKTGTCKYGSLCKYHHPLDRRGAVTLNTLGLPIREEEKPCPYYMRTYSCKFGPACKYDHPQPASFETALPVPGPTVVGTMGSNLPSTGSPYVCSLPAWSMSRSSYLASSLVAPPFRSPLTDQSSNNYMGNLSSVTASNMMVPNSMYNSKHHDELVTGGRGDLVIQVNSNLPDRPDQPQCRFFMSTGSCKYGSNCKFHHPKERITHNLGPHGLPCRPGGDQCSYFNSYGFCKYGQTCKYDHPIYVSCYPGPIPYVNLPFFPIARNMVISNPSETFHSKSPKITDWIQKPKSISDKNRQNAVEKTMEDPGKEVRDDHRNSTTDAPAPSISKIPQDQSD